MKKKARSKLRLRLKGFYLLTLTLFFIAGCATPSKEVSPPTASIKVAIFPFYNISGYRDAGKIVANVFVTEMFKSGRFLVEEPGNIAHFMMQERIDTLGEIEIERLKILGKRLGVDAVMTGTVEEFDDGRGGISSVPTVSITARMISSNTGQLVWSAQNKKRGDDYIVVLDLGEVRSLTTLTQKVAVEMISTIQ
jgi:TolB-like protein